MAERASAIAHLPVSSASDRPSGFAVRLAEEPPGSILQVTAWPDTVATVQAVLGELLNVTAPEPGQSTTAPGVTVMAVAPGRYLVASTSADLVARFEAALPASDGAVVDLSHGRAVLKLEGAAAPAILAKGVAIDLSATAFSPARVVQTMIHHVDVTIVRRDSEAFDLWVLRSFAESMAEWLLDAGLEFGIDLVR